MVRTFNKLVAPLARRLRLLVGRGVVNLVDDSQPVQRLQITIMADDTYGTIERFQNYGHTSVPLPGAEHVTVSIGGDPGHLVVIVVEDDRFRPRDLKPGESAIYSFKGARVICRDSNSVEVVADAFRVSTQESEIEGHVTVNGHVNAKTGWSGTFTADGMIMTVRNGSIIDGV
jgi:phage baseplate assembly protein V